MVRVAVVGAGFTGAVIARELADSGIECTVFDGRAHLAGNCHTVRDPMSGVMVHEYGPHIFHTANPEIWAYINRFARMIPYRHRVIAESKSHMYSLPVNLLTINQLYGKTFTPAEAESFVKSRAISLGRPAETLEEHALSTIGPELFDAFFRGYTEKQWGRPCSELPPSVIKRLPVRFTYDDSYFSHPYQAIPQDGYTAIVDQILCHSAIRVSLSSLVGRLDLRDFDHVVWTGPIDQYFDFEIGRLPYRTLRFERECATGDIQGTAVVNFCDAEVAATRRTEFAHFAPWESQRASVTFLETPDEATETDVPYYPVRLAGDEDQLRAYVRRAVLERGVTFAGRLGTYRYLDMDVAIAEALDLGRQLASALRTGSVPPSFAKAPLDAVTA